MRHIRLGVSIYFSLLLSPQYYSLYLRDFICRCVESGRDQIMGSDITQFQDDDRDSDIYPATLAFGLPIVLAILGYKSGDQFMRASVWFAGMIAVILVAASNFEEIRGEQMLIPLLSPAALYGLRRVLGEPAALQRPPQPADTLPVAASRPVARSQIRSSPRPP
jgi:hypothetical protein